jgi:sec-independent protein translocase protein TatA
MRWITSSSSKESIRMPGWLGPWEILIVVVIIVLIFGGRLIPRLGRSLGGSIMGLKKGLKEGEEGFKEAIKEDGKVDAQSQGPVDETAQNTGTQGNSKSDQG